MFPGDRLHGRLNVADILVTLSFYNEDSNDLIKAIKLQKIFLILNTFLIVSWNTSTFLNANPFFS